MASVLSTAPGESLLQALLIDLEQLDIRLWVEGERLRFDAPQGALTPELRQRLQCHKEAIIAFLRGKQQPAPQDEQPAAGPHGQGSFPLSFAQRHFGRLQKLNPTHCYYNVPFAYRLAGKLDVPTLRQSFKAIIRRHDFLRTTLQEVGGALRQVVSPFTDDAGSLPLTDVQGLPQSAHDEAINRAMREEWQTPFDLARDCPVRLRLLRLAEEEHVLLLCLHNVLFEAGSLSALLHELSTHYAALAAGQPCPLPPLPMQYADCVRWQQAQEATGMEARLAYWREWFAKGEPPPLTLAIARRTELPTTFEAGILCFDFPAPLTTALAALCQQAGVTLFIPLLCAYAIVLRKHSGYTDIVLGTTFVNRNHWKLDPLIGSMLNVVALRFDLSGDTDFIGLLRSMRDTVLSAFSQQQVPFSSIAPLLQPEQPRGTPLFRTVFTFLGELPHDKLQLPAVDVTLVDNIYCESMFPDLYPTVWEKKTATGTVLTSYWQYKRELYDETTIQRMIEDFQATLTAMASAPERSSRTTRV